MRLVGCMPVRNEDWIVGLSLRAALLWCDEMVVLLHSSFDKSRIIVEEIAKSTNRVICLRFDNPDWDEMRHRHAMLECAREMGATHVAIVDADEILTANLIPILQTQKQRADRFCPPGYILTLPGFNLRHGIHEYHSNAVWGNRWFSLAFQDDPRLCWQGDTFHHREPHGATLEPFRPITHEQGGIMHLWGASERRLLAKHALYKMTETLRWPKKPIDAIDSMYSLAVKPREPWTFSHVPHEWWHGYKEAGLLEYLDVDREPWQIAECQRLMEQYGAQRFQGLDLFGIA